MFPYSAVGNIQPSPYRVELHIVFYVQPWTHHEPKNQKYLMQPRAITHTLFPSQDSPKIPKTPQRANPGMNIEIFVHSSRSTKKECGDSRNEIIVYCSIIIEGLANIFLPPSPIHLFQISDTLIIP